MINDVQNAASEQQLSPVNNGSHDFSLSAMKGQERDLANLLCERF
jgi:hypothetical protein